MAKAKVEIFLDMGVFSATLADNMAQAVAAEAKNRARHLVAVDSGDLRNSIRLEKVFFASYQVVSDLPYSLAQEYGRPDLQSYKFTPYMRPAAQYASTAEVVQKVLSRSVTVAFEKGKTR